MLMTYDFIRIAQSNNIFMEELQRALASDADSEICTNTHRLRFYAKEQAVLVEPFSETSDFHWKIVPKKIAYRALDKMLNGDWDSIEAGDIVTI